MNQNMKNILSDAAGIPKDVVLGIPILTMIGRNEVIVENYRGIIEYTDEILRLQTKTGEIKIQGREMKIEYYTNDEMRVYGKIISLEFGKRVCDC